MLNVATPENAQKIISEETKKRIKEEEVVLWDAVGRVCAHNITSDEFLPAFDRSTVDGYAVSASDTYGYSDTLPAVLELCGEIEMGENTVRRIKSGECCKIPTGGRLPENADCVVMLEYCEDIGDGFVYIMKSAAVYENVSRTGEDCRRGGTLAEKDTVLTPRHIGAMAAAGVGRAAVYKSPVVGIVSTGDEIVGFSEKPTGSQIRDVNSVMLSSSVKALGLRPVIYPVCPDNVQLLSESVKKALTECDVLLISGGSSAGEKDNAARVLSALGEIKLHGIAIKPGKPTIFAVCGDKLVFGLPGHPGAAFYVFDVFVKPALLGLQKKENNEKKIKAVLTQNVPSNNGRATVCPVTLDGGAAFPVFMKSGAVVGSIKADGYFIIERDTEGYPSGREVEVTVFET